MIEHRTQVARNWATVALVNLVLFLMWLAIMS